MKIIKSRFLFINLLLSGLMFSPHVVFSQDPPPPPRPLIYGAPDRSLLKKFVPDDKAFEVVFAGDPSIKNTETNDFKTISFETYRDGSHSTIVIYKYNRVMDQNRDALYNVIRQNLLKTPKTTIESEIELKKGEIDGREFNVLSDYTFKRTRVFANAKVVYVVSCDVTNWHILNNHYKEKVAEFKTESERFLNSFKIKK